MAKLSMKNFHAKSLDVEVATTGKLKWIKKYVPAA